MYQLSELIQLILDIFSINIVIQYTLIRTNCINAFFHKYTIAPAQ